MESVFSSNSSVHFVALCLYAIVTASFTLW